MKVHRRFGVAVTALGAVLALSSLAVSQAGAIAVVNPTFHEGNATTCADVGLTGATLLEGSIHSGTYTTPLIDYTVTHHRYVTLTRVDPTVTVHAVVVKGGSHYYVYNPPVSNMRSPFNDGDNIPELSHWFLCYGVKPADTTTTTVVDTTTTVEDTTTTVVDTTTTVEDTSTTVEDTTTTVVDVEGPTTTLAPTTTLVDSEGPTTTAVAAEGPTTTVATGALPRTGSGADTLLVVGLGLVCGGILSMLLGRRTADA